MLAIADKNGFMMSRNNMRSLVFEQRKKGRVQPEGDLYRWVPTHEKAATTDEEAAA